MDKDFIEAYQVFMKQGVGIGFHEMTQAIVNEGIRIKKVLAETSGCKLFDPEIGFRLETNYAVVA